MLCLATNLDYQVMEDAHAAALQNSTYRKEHDKERTLQARQRLN